MANKLLDLKTLFRQNDFSGGLDAQLDPTKTPSNAYPLLINGRSRENVITPTNKHVQIPAPLGNYQGLYVFGEYLLLFVDGYAYYADITQPVIVFRQIDGWTVMSATVERIYAELAPATANMFNRQGVPDEVEKVFNNRLSVFREAIYCFDGTVNPPQAINSNGTTQALGSYATWTVDDPLYVPSGSFPSFAGAKLYVASVDKKRILSSVSGRASDFVVNIDPSGNKGGDADTTSQTVSFNSITAMRGLSTGEVLVGTLYGTFVLELDTAHPQFGEPYLQPRFLFPAGPVNEISIIDVLSDTVMITQSGIHAFNAVAQAKRESNNFPFGAKIRKLITNPTSRKSIVQSDTCAGMYDDYAFFGLNTVYGYGAIVFDTTTQHFQGLDLSFGHVKQFATTKIQGNERMFYITHENAVYEAFAGEEKNPCRALFGEWTPSEAPADSMAYMTDAVFVNVVGSGQVKLSFFSDRVLRESKILEVENGIIINNLPIPIPFVEGQQVAKVGIHFGGNYRSWKCAVMVEWNFGGDLAGVSVDGKVESADNTRLAVSELATTDKLAFIADSGYSDELDLGGNFPAEGFTLVDVVKGSRYAYLPGGNGPLVNGVELLRAGAIFTAAGSTVAVRGTGAMTFSLRTAENYMTVIEAVRKETNLIGLLHGGNFAPPLGDQDDVTAALLPINIPLHPVVGEQDWITNTGEYFFGALGVPRYYHKDFTHLSVFFFNGNPTEPDGISAVSEQTAIVKRWLARSDKPFNILIVHFPLWSNALEISPGNPALRHLAELPKLSAILSGNANNYERFGQFGCPVFNCGSGGQDLIPFDTVDSFVPAYQNAVDHGYLAVSADALSCRVSFKDTNNVELDAYTLYSK